MSPSPRLRDACEYPACSSGRKAQWFMGWVSEDGTKVWGMVCDPCDRQLGQRHVVADQERKALELELR